MRIKEVEEKLGIDRETIRFYIKEDLISPEQGSNRYREYTEEDVRQLKRILIMRDLDMSVEDIRSVLRGDKDLIRVLRQKKRDLEKKQAFMAGVTEICSELIEADDAAFDPEEIFQKRESLLS